MSLEDVEGFVLDDAAAVVVDLLILRETLGARDLDVNVEATRGIVVAVVLVVETLVLALALARVLATRAAAAVTAGLERGMRLARPVRGTGTGTAGRAWTWAFTKAGFVFVAAREAGLDSTRRCRT